MISLSNLSLLVILPLTYVLSKYATRENLQQSSRLLFVVRGGVIGAVFLCNSDSATLAALSLFTLQLIASLQFYLNGIVMNSFEDSKF